jgi:predicted aspartyl protease
MGPQHGFTIRANGRVNQLLMPVVITVPDQPSKQVQINALWDTGASMTVITKKVVDAIGLQPTGMIYVSTASESRKQVNTYLVDLFLKQDVRISSINVNIGILDGFDCLIGMDIITLVDFSITNLNGKTCFSFRVPSQHEVDFVKEIGKQKRRNFLYQGKRK